jgi:hypothetical protein
LLQTLIEAFMRLQYSLMIRFNLPIPVANTEEGLTATVRRYNEEVDPKHEITSTRKWYAMGVWGLGIFS